MVKHTQLRHSSFLDCHYCCSFVDAIRRVIKCYPFTLRDLHSIFIKWLNFHVGFTWFSIDVEVTHGKEEAI